MSRERNHGIDLLRMLSMYFVVILHVLGQGGVLSSTAAFSANYHTAWLLEALTFCAVNCYALISGFVGINSKFKLSNILYLWLQVVFYTLLTAALFAVFMPGTVGKRVLLRAILPVTSGDYWFFTAYFGLFFLMPILNHVVHTLNKAQSRYLICVLLVLFSVVPTLRYKDVFQTASGYSVLWLAVMYLLGAFIGKYELHRRFSGKKAVICFCLCVIATWGVKFLAEKLTLRFIGDAWYGDLLYKYTSPTMVLAALSLLICFAGLRIEGKGAVRLISLMSPAAFGVYLIHCEPLIFGYLLGGAFAGFASLPTVLLILSVLGSAAAIYFICSAADLIRLKLFDALKIRKLCARLNKLTVFDHQYSE